MTTSYLFYAMLVFMGLALGAVIFGLVQSIKGSVKTNLNSGKAMKVRILFQGLALILFGVLMYINKGGIHG